MHSSKGSKIYFKNGCSFLKYLFFLGWCSLGTVGAQSMQDSIPQADKNLTTLGFSVLNSALGIDPFVSTELFSPDKLTLANQVFIEQEFFNGFGIMLDALYFTEKAIITTSNFDEVRRFSGFQFELALTKNIFRVDKFLAQIEVGYNFAPQKYEILQVPNNGDPESLIEEIDYDINGFKFSSRFEYELNTLFSVFLKSSLNQYTANYEGRENSFTKFFPLDAFGICRSF